MFPGLNPKKMQAMMSKMGISQQEIDANKVIIEKDDGNIIINNPSVVKINMQGQENFQISGDITTSSESSDSEASNIEEDIQTIIEKTGCSEEQAKQALEKANGDLTEAIISLS